MRELTDNTNITPTTKIIFHYTDKLGNKQSIQTIYRHARELLIELLEQTQFDEITDLYYTVKNVTRKLDYYNTIV